MGKIADALRGVAMPEQKRIQVLSLDQQFSDLEAENKALKLENTKLQAQVNPLQREVDSLKQRVEKQDSASLDDLSEKMLLEIANQGYAEQQRLFEHFQLSIFDYHIDILTRRNFIEVGPTLGMLDAYFLATPDGRQYLANKNLL
jgi:hypothetical protein